MESHTVEKFYEDIATKSADTSHYDKLHFNIGQYKKKLPEGKAQFNNIEEVRNYLNVAKQNAISQLDSLLECFEYNFTEKGGKVLWADTAEDAVAHVIHICKTYGADLVVKSKSMVSEEIELNHFLEKFGIEPIETDLGEFIQQLQGEPPYHILTPAMHKSKEEVAELFRQKFDCPPGLSPSEITETTRHLLRGKFLKAKVGITGANFIVADTGSIVITENEGNARMATIFPDVHIAIVGIEKVIQHVDDLPVFLPMLATHGTGQQLTSYNTIFTGAPQTSDGKLKPVYVILLNNGRTNLLADPDMYSSLFCIRCGACLNACPIYKTIGGHAYGTTYSGPIGAVISPHLRSMKDYGHLSFASSLCGACTEVCPVKIPIHELLLKNRQQYVQAGMDKSGGKLWKNWAFMMKNRWIFDMIPLWVKHKLIRKYIKSYSQKEVVMNPISPSSSYSQIREYMAKEKSQ